jgi:predicted PurR-regulated permease PerM
MVKKSWRIDSLAAIKFLHTFVWAVVAGSILALPFTALVHRFDRAMILTAIIAAELAILALNRGRCPLTGLAARITTDRADNFDIYLPNWLARHNKTIFGSILAVNELFVLWYWLR